MQKKLTYEYVKNYIEVESKSDCKLISNEYKNNNTKLELQCKCGKIFFVTFHDFSKNISPTRCCSDCSKYIRWNFNKVNDYVKNNSNCILLSKYYINIDEKLKFCCECGNVFETSFYNFYKNNKKQCNECGKFIQINKQKLTYEEVKNYIEVISGSGCKLLSKEYANYTDKLMIQCHCGKCYSTSFAEFKGLNKIQCNDCSNHHIWTYDDVKKYIEDESNSNCKLVSKEYKTMNDNLILKCKCGEEFIVTFGNFYYRNVTRCILCANISRSNLNKNSYEEVKNFIEVDSNSGCELVSKKYINSEKKLAIKCKCGNLFNTTFNSFKTSNKRQCNECGKLKLLESITFSYEYIKNYIESNSKCILLSKEYSGYNNYDLLVKCNCGNEYITSFGMFCRGKRQCNFCSNLHRWTYEEVKNYIEVESKSGCKLLSSNYINNSQKLKIQCKCGNIYFTDFGNFVYLNKIRCDKCSNKESTGEYIIRSYFEKNNINFLAQYKFKDCKNKRCLPFDFAVFDNESNLIFCLEYNGKQHYEPINYFGGIKEFNYTQNNDKIKIKYCKDNKIKLIIIPFWDFDRIEEILEKELN
jgi:hypothetical protein